MGRFGERRSSIVIGEISRLTGAGKDGELECMYVADETQPGDKWKQAEVFL